jgi:NAD(P)-dependent dehydrogenase (short-subunit alcohol dehydrogenase family)
VVLVARSQPDLDRLAARLLAHGAQALAAPADVTSPAEVQAAVALAMERTGRLDVVVNNAGIAVVQPLEAISLDDWQRSLASTLTGAFLVTQAARPHLKPGAVIINILSVAARTGFPHWSAYCAAKAGLDGFSRAIREEFRPHGIRVACILPAATDTALWDQIPGVWPREHMLAPEVVAQAVLYAANAPADVTVEELVVGHVAGRL